MTSQRLQDPIQIINFVYETQNLTLTRPVTEPVYKVCIVAEGQAEIFPGTTGEKVEKGDIFFLLPAVPYTISSDPDFAYMYISFMGIRAGMIMEWLKITKKNYVFPGFEQLLGLWQEGMQLKSEVTDLVSEGILLCTFAAIGDRAVTEQEYMQRITSDNIMPAVKKYMDVGFADSDLSLEMIAKEFSYNKNYLSALFKKTYGMGIREYLNMVRINHSCVLMEQNGSSIEDIAYLCGYRDRMYFSKVFKQRIGVTPKEYMKNRGFGKVT